MRIQHTTQNLNSCKNISYGGIPNARNIISNVAQDGKPLKGLEKFYQSEGLKKFLTSKGFDKLLDLSVKNPVILTSVYSLFLCTLLRPATIMALPGKNVDDKKYASAHSIASGVIGLAVTAAILTPVGQRVKRVFKNPAKYLKPETVKRMFPNVATKEVEKDGQKVMEIVTHDGKMLQTQEFENMRNAEIAELKKKGIYDKLNPLQKENLQDREVPYLCMSNEPIIHNGQPLRSAFFKKANGEACALQSNGTPVLDSMKVSERQNENAEKILKMVPDLLVAAPRAAITVATIPFILTKVFGIKKPVKDPKPEEIKEVSFNSNQAGLQSFDYTELFPGLKKEVQ
ncbi:hypothetical protein IJI31_06810 [bacterium]|nr:hypothetical protein [bacterium]